MGDNGWEQNQEDTYYWDNQSEALMRLANMVELGFITFGEDPEDRGPWPKIVAPGDKLILDFKLVVPYELMKEALEMDLAQAMEARGEALLRMAAALMKKQKEENHGNEQQENQQGP